MNFRPMLFIAIGVCLGIVSAYLYNYVGKIWSALSFILPLITLIIFLVKSKGKGKFLSTLIFSVVVVIMFVLSFFNFKINVDGFERKSAGNMNYSVSGRICDYSELDDYQTLILDSVQLKGGFIIKTDYKMIVYLSDTSGSFEIGDRVSFSSIVSDMTSIYEDRFSANYVSNGVKYRANVSPTDVTFLGNDKTIFEKINLSIRDTLKGQFDRQTFATAYALLCGNSDYIDADILANYRAVGVAHVFAVSGLHIGFLAMILRFVLTKLKINKYVRVFLTISILIFYSGVCGFSSSSIRATIMCATSLLASLSGKKYDALSSVALSMIIVLLINPVQLFCVGFQLSFGVVFGIILLNKPIARKLKFMPKKLASALSVVVSAQLISLPIMLGAFREISSISILANLIFVPIIGTLYVVLFLGSMLSLIFGGASVFLFIPKYVLIGIDALFSFGDYSMFMIGGITFGGFAVSYFLMLILSSDLINLKRKIKSIFAVILCVITVGGVTGYNVSDSRSVKMYVSGSNTLSATVFELPDENVVILNKVNYIFYPNGLKRAISRTGRNKIDHLIIPESSTGADVQVIVSKLLHVADIKNVYYTTTLSSEILTVLDKTFTDITFNKLSKDGELTFDKLQMNVIFDGYAIDVLCQDYRAVLFSSLGKKTEELHTLSLGDMDLIIASDFADVINYLYMPKQMMTYTNSVNYKNGEKQGNYLIKIK